MKATYFENGQIRIDTWPSDLHVTHTHGYAYDLGSHYAYLCGGSCPYIGWSMVERDAGPDLASWCQSNFSGSNLADTKYNIGETIKSVWRPGIFSPAELHDALGFTETEHNKASQALRILISNLDNILLYVEPDTNHLNVYGHNIRNLLISACTEVENYFQYYMTQASATPRRGNYFNVTDYVRLQPALYLDEFKIDMFSHPVVGEFTPFENWSPSSVVLPWYDAYNKTKHNRDADFHRATLESCIHAVGACLVLYSVRFGPTWWQSNFVNSPIPDAYKLFRQPEYTGDPSNVYIPKIQLPSNANPRIWGNLSGDVEAWKTLPFQL